jgi:hypothetical protein
MGLPKVSELPQAHISLYWYWGSYKEARAALTTVDYCIIVRFLSQPRIGLPFFMIATIHYCKLS